MLASALTRRCNPDFTVEDALQGSDPLYADLDKLTPDERRCIYEGFDTLYSHALVQSEWRGGRLTAYDANDRDLDWRPTMPATRGLDLLADKRNSNNSDRLAILSKLCNYGVRLNTRALEEQFTFSQCVLTLALLNNDWSFFDKVDVPALTGVFAQGMDPDPWDCSIEHCLLRYDTAAEDGSEQLAQHFLCSPDGMNVYEG